jgi:acetylornithine deacetylase
MMRMAASMDTVEILERLVSFPTVSRDSNLPLIDWVRNYLADHGVDSRLISDVTGRKSNVLASIGPEEEGGVVLSGHSDVVPTDGQNWSSDPFKLTACGSRLHARGACDMKGFIAAALSRVPAWSGASLSRPVHLMFSYDEEVGCLGAPSMIAAAKHLIPKPAAVIVGEPTGMRVATQHKGICVMRTCIRGIEAHSSLTHQGVSAIMLAGELIAHLGYIERRLVARAVEHHCRGQFEPPYTTLSVNRIGGGTAGNILAASCDFIWDIRTLPGDSAEPILTELDMFAQARLKALRARGMCCLIDTHVQADVPPLREDEGPAQHLAHRAGGLVAESIAVPFATEAGQFQQAGWSTVVCGPGDIDQAHKPDEYIEHSQLTACEVFLDRLVGDQCE